MTTQEMLSPFRRAITKYSLISDGDRIAVGLSGGKDSVTLLALLSAYKRFSPEKFELCAINVDLGFELDGKQVEDQKAYLDGIGVPLITVKSDIGQIVFDIRKEENPCSLCAKMRRGALCGSAKEAGFNKIALGHHSDDLIETFFMSMVYEGRLSTFAPMSYMSRSDVTVIRPMLFIDEKDISAYVKQEKLPVVFNPCPANHVTSREKVKSFVASMRALYPQAKERTFDAIISPERYNLFDKFERECKDLSKALRGNRGSDENE